VILDKGVNLDIDAFELISQVLVLHGKFLNPFLVGQLPLNHRSVGLRYATILAVDFSH